MRGQILFTLLSALALVKAEHAHKICADEASEGVLVAHEICNEFYQCSGGVPIELKCPGRLLFNTAKDNCDWPANVDCGDRVIVELDSDEDNNGDGGSDKEGNCNGNPAEAPWICASHGSDGVLVAHENCNQFYNCLGGKPVSLTCPNGLLYNPKKEICDWPIHVDCGDRVIPGIDVEIDHHLIEALLICAADNSINLLLAHRNCNQFYQCSNRKPVSLKCPFGLLYNPNKEICDWPVKVNCGDRIIPGTEVRVDNNGDRDSDIGIGNPGIALLVCAASNSEGVLVAHENCNQFYKCANGKPISLDCPSGLFYNPKKGVCDWPANVDCGDRLLNIIKQA